MNVHPQKREVRFRDPNAVHSLIHRSLLEALGGAKGATPVEASAFAAPSPLRPPGGRRRSAASLLAEAVGALERDAGPGSAGRGGGVELRRRRPRPTRRSGPLRLLGQYRNSFLVAESEAGLVLIDQHVAHERVRYERILARLETSDAPSQSLLLPVSFEATPDEAALLSRADALLAAAGFVVSERGARSFAVTAAPADTPASAVAPFLRDFLSPRRGAARRQRRRDAPPRGAGGVARLPRRGDGQHAARAGRGDAAPRRPLALPRPLDLPARPADPPDARGLLAPEAVREELVNGGRDLFAPKFGLTLPLCGLNFIFFLLIQMDPQRTLGLFAFLPDAALARPWTFVTYQFLNTGALGLFFGTLMLWFLGSALEAEWGTPEFTAFWLVATLGGSLRRLDRRRAARLRLGDHGRLDALLLRVALSGDAVPDLLRRPGEGEVAGVARSRDARLDLPPVGPRGTARGRLRDALRRDGGVPLVLGAASRGRQGAPRGEGRGPGREIRRRPPRGRRSSSGGTATSSRA